VREQANGPFFFFSPFEKIDGSKILHVVVERFKWKERKGVWETICFAIENGLFSPQFRCLEEEVWDSGCGFGLGAPC